MNHHFSSSKFLTDLIDIYGSPSQSGFGSAVFHEKKAKDADLESLALQYYKYFVGDLWTRFGETAWLSSWKQVYVRQTGTISNIVSELQTIVDREVTSFLPVLFCLDIQQKEKAQKTLSAVYDASDIVDLRVYTIGDGGAMSGLLIMGYSKTGETTILISLLD